jgi:hypothetical protein
MLTGQVGLICCCEESLGRIRCTAEVQRAMHIDSAGRRSCVPCPATRKQNQVPRCQTAMHMSMFQLQQIRRKCGRPMVSVRRRQRGLRSACFETPPPHISRQAHTHAPRAGSLWAAVSNRLHTDVQSVQATPVERHVGASVSAQPEPEPCSACPPLGITSTGVIWALTIIAGVRLGRAESERNRLDLWRQVLSDLI